MSYKFLIAIFLGTTINLLAAEPYQARPYEVRIVFANNPFSHGYKRTFLSNELTPIRRFFASKLDAYNFVKRLNKINEQEPTGLNKINAMKRVIDLSGLEQRTLRATIVETADGVKHFIGGYLVEPTNIYVQQICPVKIAPAAATLPVTRYALKPIKI